MVKLSRNDKHDLTANSGKLIQIFFQNCSFPVMSQTEFGKLIKNFPVMSSTYFWKSHPSPVPNMDEFSKNHPEMMKLKFWMSFPGLSGREMMI